MGPNRKLTDGWHVKIHYHGLGEILRHACCALVSCSPVPQGSPFPTQGSSLSILHLELNGWHTDACCSGNIGKPFLDMVIFTSQLAASLGPLGTVGLFANYGLTAFILRKATPAFGRMAATEARLEGEYRAGLGRIGRDGEEVAFYNGGLREKGILLQGYDKLRRHLRMVDKVRIPYGLVVLHYPLSAAGGRLLQGGNQPG